MYNFAEVLMRIKKGDQGNSLEIGCRPVSFLRYAVTHVTAVCAIETN